MQHMSKQDLLDWLARFPSDYVFEAECNVETKYSNDGVEYVPEGAKTTVSLTYYPNSVTTLA